MALTNDPTAQADLPRPKADQSDDANVPYYVRALADRLEEIIVDGDGGFGWEAGDFKISSRTASWGRWLLCDGSAKSQAEIEAVLGLDAGEAAALVTLWGTGAASIYDTDDTTAAGKVRLPNAQGRAVSIIGGAGSGLTNRSRGEAYGAETVTLTAAQSGLRDHAHASGSLVIPNHTHGAGTLTIPNHTHDKGSLAAPDHLHGAGSLVPNDHTHSMYFNTGGPSGYSDYALAGGGLHILVPYYNHIHLVSGATGGADNLAISGQTGAADRSMALASGVTGNVPSANAVAGATANVPSANGVTGDTAIPNSVHATNGAAATASHPNVPPSYGLGSLFVRV